MKFDIEYIEKLSKIIAENGLTEISLEDSEQAITIRKDLPEVVATPSIVPAPAVTCSTTVTPAQTVKEEKDAPKGKPITSPMVGTFYAAPSPEANPFVEVGTEVAIGDVVCIIEAMKLMNEIKAEQAGKVVQLCVKNGEPVEFGQVLMYVE